ncbi:hypothetical protein N9N49_04905, partial [Candidatus Pelagibacter bacterium]
RNPDFSWSRKTHTERRKMKFIKILFFLFLVTFTTHSFAKSNEYYQQTLIHVLTECNSTCQKQVFEQEVHKAFFVLMDVILNQIRFELSLKEKELHD